MNPSSSKPEPESDRATLKRMLELLRQLLGGGLRLLNAVLDQLGDNDGTKVSTPYTVPTANDACKDATVLPAERLMPNDCWMTISSARKMVDTYSGTISRAASCGRIVDNKKKRLERRVLKSSVLLWVQEKKERDLKPDSLNY